MRVVRRSCTGPKSHAGFATTRELAMEDETMTPWSHCLRLFARVSFGSCRRTAAHLAVSTRPSEQCAHIRMAAMGLCDLEYAPLVDGEEAGEAGTSVLNEGFLGPDSLERKVTGTQRLQAVQSSPALPRTRKGEIPPTSSRRKRSC